MRALVYAGPHRMEVRDEPVPVPNSEELLVRIEACGICGSDMHVYHGKDPTRPPSTVLGHEAAGTVVSGARAGERVAVNPLVTCDECDFCRAGHTQLCRNRQIISRDPRPGAFAEYIAIPPRNLTVLPAGMPIAEAALAEPMAVSWHAVKLGLKALRKPLDKAIACVIGGGPIGLCAELVLGLHGANRLYLCEPNAVRRTRAEKEALSDIVVYAPDGPGGPARDSVDLVIDCVGSVESRAAACRMAGRGGVIICVGVLHFGGGLDDRKILMDELAVAGAYCYTAEEFADVVKALGSGRLGRLGWYETRPIGAGPLAFDQIAAGTAEIPKIILLPQER
ncbi:L-iditol 2-dehydrogenase [Rhizobium aquaticum]|uniref:L-iditol 2-dehydrogenase n=1 Tax=Rhizobium aquaticum TaxID=1549636 RepID=A0ABV2J7M5_9HYPH